MNPRLKDLLVGGDGGGSNAADAGLALLRLAFGLPLALAHGLGKLPPSARFVEGVAEMGFPVPVAFAWAAAVAEFGGGLLLALGLLTRPAAFFVAFTMAVAFFLRHSGDAFGDRELPLLYGAAAVVLMLTGSGRFGLDALFRRRDRRYVQRFRR